jgi:hypothetical protein
MNHAQQLAERRALLIDRAARQRTELAEWSQQLERPAGFFDKGYALARGIRSHPALALGAGLVAITLLRKSTFIGKFAGTALTAAKIGISLAKWLLLRKFGSQSTPWLAR